jgi:NAD(P)-dependent dehydrogenase (short-subunit alcohol dehydrogenase family)
MKGTSKAQPTIERPFAGKVALITGAASGIGRATALAFGRAGAHVVVADTAVDGGHASAAMIVESGGKALFVRSDITRAGDVEALVEKAINYYGRLDIAINNAGIDEDSASVAEGDEEQFDRIMAANVKGVWLCMKYQLRQMLKQGSGAIVNVTSAPALGRAVQMASRHAVVGLTRSAAAEYARDGIRINVLCPGGVRTPTLARLADRDPAAEARLMAANPMGRFADTVEVANAALWLASDGASYVNGHELVIDGGLTAL